MQVQTLQPKPGTERVQALTDISRSALCCHSNEIRALIANLPNSAQLEGTLYHSTNLHIGPCSSAGMRTATDRQTQTHSRDHYIHFALAVPLAKCNNSSYTGPGKINPQHLPTTVMAIFQVKSD